MFGLQAPVYEDVSAYDRHRLHYCGSCKLIAKEYGQSSRILLNYDLVFLAELLTALAEEDVALWEPNLQAVNQCFKLTKGKETPEVLNLIAALHLFLAELKLEDQILDQAACYWSWGKSLFQSKFKKAAQQLSEYGLDVEDCYQIANRQLLHEQTSPQKFESLEAYLMYSAEPTATISAQVLALAKKYILKDVDPQILTVLGFEFGCLTYLIDAYEDREKDLKKGDFNPFLKWGASEDQAWNLLLKQKERVELLLLELPLMEELKTNFVVRLSSNLFKKKKKEAVSKWEMAKTKASAILCEPKGLSSQLKYNILSWAFFIQPEQNLQNWWLRGGLFALFGLLATAVFPNHLKQRVNPCRRRSQQCKKAIIGVLVVLALIGLLVLGFMIWGLILLIQGTLVWGLILLLLFPLIAGVFFLVRAIRRARMTKRERKKADRKVRRKKRLFKFLYKKSTN